MNRILFIGFLVLASCSHKSKQAIHHKNIPDEAFWVGNEQRGYWYLVHRIHPHKNNAYITIYDELNGNVIMSKNFILVCNTSDEITLIEDIKSQILAFDGKTIKFKSIDGESGCYLQ